MSAGDVSMYGEWLVQEANGCTCQGSDAHYGHQPGCGYEPLLKLDAVLDALKAAGYAVLELPRVAHKGPNDTDASMFRRAAANLEDGHHIGGGNLQAAIIKLLRSAADALDAVSA